VAKSAEYAFNHEVDIKALYRMALDGRAIGQDFQTLSRNFTSASRPLLTFNANYNISFSENIEYDKGSFTYFSKEPGYVHYTENEITLLPFLHISKTQTSCIAVVPARGATEEILSSAVVKNCIATKEILIPVDEKNINRIMELYTSGEGGVAEVCRGRDPVNGRPEIVTLKYQIKTSIGTADETGKMDYKSRNFVNNIKRGDLVASYEPPITASPGITIFNTKAEPVMETPFTHKMGPGITLKAEEKIVISELDGVLHISEDNTISVTDLEVIHGDVDLNVGNLEVNGNILVEGNVLPGYEVIATGNITVKGNIEEASIRCGGSLTVEGGIIGSPQTEITVEHGVQANFIRNGKVTAKDDVEIATSVMNSTITTNGAVYAKADKKGKVFGGVISGRKGVEVYSAGNISGVKTHLMAGVDLERETKIKEATLKVKESTDMIVRLKNGLGVTYFENPKLFFQKLDPAKLPQVKKIIEALKASIQTKRHYDDELIRLQQSDSEDKAAQIILYKEAFEGTSVQICNKTIQLEKGAPSPTRFIYDRETAEIIPMSVASAAKSTAKK